MTDTSDCDRLFRSNGVIKYVVAGMDLMCVIIVGWYT